MRERPLIYQGIPQSITVILDVVPLKQSVLVEAPTEIPSAVQLNASAAGGSYLDVPVRNLPYNFSVITQDYMRERGVTNLLDALELVSGVTTWADTGYIPAVDIRGLSTTDAGIYFATEGIVQNSVPQAARNMDAFFLDSVEVLKGPSSFSYGSGTAGASINTRMKSPKREFGMDSLLSYGSFGQTRVGVGITGPLTKTLAGRIDLVQSHGGTNIQRSESTYRGLNIGLIWTPLKRVTIAAKGIYLQDHVSPYFSTPLLNTRVDPNVHYIAVAANTFLDPRARTLNYNISDPRNESINRLGTLTSEVDLSRGWQLQHKLYGTMLHLDSLNSEGLSFNQNTLLVTPGNYFFNFKRDWMVGNNVNLRNTFRFWEGRSLSFTVGGTVERNNQRRIGADPSYGSAGTPPAMDYLNPIAFRPLQEHFTDTRHVDTDYDTGYFEAAFQMLPKLTLSGGARLDHITNSVLTLATNTRNTVRFSSGNRPVCVDVSAPPDGHAVHWTIQGGSACRHRHELDGGDSTGWHHSNPGAVQHATQPRLGRRREGIHVARAPSGNVVLLPDAEIRHPDSGTGRQCHDHRTRRQGQIRRHRYVVHGIADSHVLPSGRFCLE